MLFTVVVQLQFVLDVVEVVHVELARLLRVLQHDDVTPLEWLVGQQVLPVLVLDVELLDGVVGEDVARAADAGDVRVVVEYLEEDRAVDLALGVLVYLQLDQVGGRHLLACHGVGLVLLEEPDDFIHVLSFALGMKWARRMYKVEDVGIRGKLQRGA